MVCHMHKKEVLLLCVEENLEETFLRTFRNATHTVTQEVTLQNNLYTKHA